MLLPSGSGRGQPPSLQCPGESLCQSKLAAQAPAAVVSMLSKCHGAQGGYNDGCMGNLLGSRPAGTGILLLCCCPLALGMGSRLLCSVQVSLCQSKLAAQAPAAVVSRLSKYCGAQEDISDGCMGNLPGSRPAGAGGLLLRCCPLALALSRCVSAFASWLSQGPAVTPLFRAVSRA